MTPTEFKWTVRARNTARLPVLYRELNGNIIPTTGCIGTLYIYDSGIEVLTKVATNDPAEGKFDIFLTVSEILALGFRQGEYEFVVEFPNGDVTTLVDGPLIVESGRGDFE